MLSPPRHQLVPLIDQFEKMNLLPLMFLATGYSLLALFIAFLIVLLKIFIGKSFNSPHLPPVAGTVYHQLFHFKRLFHYHTGFAHRWPTYRLLALSHSEFYTVEPRNVEHILKAKFENYGRGDYNRSIMRDLFGEGIFAVDGTKWRQQRKLASFEFSTRVLRDYSCAVFRKQAQKLVQIVGGFAKENQDIDAQVSYLPILWLMML